MSKYFKQLATLISVSLAHNTSANSIPIEKPDNKIDSGKISVADLNVTVSKHLAAHRSHSSHGSHRSHRSSSGGGYRAPATPSVPSTPPRKSEPLGQEPRPKSSYPSNTQSKSLTNTEKRKNIIKRMQLTLQFEGLYNGPIDGIMGPNTRSAVLAYKRKHGIPGDTVLDAQTLNAFGIKGY